MGNVCNPPIQIARQVINRSSRSSHLNRFWFHQVRNLLLGDGAPISGGAPRLTLDPRSVGRPVDVTVCLSVRLHSHGCHRATVPVGLEHRRREHDASSKSDISNSNKDPELKRNSFVFSMKEPHSSNSSVVGLDLSRVTTSVDSSGLANQSPLLGVVGHLFKAKTDLWLQASGRSSPVIVFD